MYEGGRLERIGADEGNEGFIEGQAQSRVLRSMCLSIEANCSLVLV